MWVSVTYGVTAKLLLMLTPLTQTAIAVLYDIYTGGYPYRPTQYPVAPHCLTELLTRLETGGLIRRK